MRTGPSPTPNSDRGFMPPCSQPVNRSRHDEVSTNIVAGEVSGSCGLHRRRGPDVLEIGYWTHRALVRKGLATAVAGLLTNAAFTVPEITQVEIHHDKANVASAGVPRSLGYRLIGERPDRAAAPDEVGIDCVWRVERAGWSGHVPAWPSTPAAGST